MTPLNFIPSVTILSDATANCCEINQSVSKKVEELPFHLNYRNFRILFSQQAIVRSMLFKTSTVPNQILKNHLSIHNHLKTTITYKNKKKRQKNKVKKRPSKKNRFFTTLGSVLTFITPGNFFL